MSNQNKIPDFFIVGAPRCGTRALYVYLKQHPKIFMPEEKEVLHFASDLLKPSDYYYDKRNYTAIFSDAKPDQIIGEASVFYLLSTQAAENIHRLNPKARIIAMIRNPIEMVHSLHSRLVYNEDEPIKDFKKALDAENDRRQGQNLPENIRFKEKLFYSQVINYPVQLTRYFEVFGREQVKVIIYDDFRKNTEKEYNDVLDFLDIKKKIKVDFKVINANKKIRYPIIRRWQDNLPEWQKRTVRKMLPDRLRKKINQKIYRLNAKHINRPPIDNILKARLVDQAKPIIDQLSQLLEKDLTNWYKQPFQNEQ